MVKFLNRFRLRKRSDSERSVSAKAKLQSAFSVREVRDDYEAILHADPSRMDPETRELYADAKAAAVTANELEDGIEKTRGIRVRNPFQTGFVITAGVLTAILVAGLLSQVTTILMYIVGALFVALGLEPLVRLLARRGVRRGVSIAIVFLGFLAIIGAVLGLVIPILVDQITLLIRIAPVYFIDISHQDWYIDLQDQLGQVIDLNGMLQIAQEFVERPENWAQVAGGVWQAGLGVANGVVAGIIVLVLSLYFLASMPAMKAGFYRMVRRTSRARVIDITEQVTASVGGYVSGQALIALTNSVLGFIMMSIVGVPFAAVVAVVVFLLALIPLVGALTATAVVTTVALFDSPTTALIALVYYLIYMQIEAYVLTPRIMGRVMKVPGAFIVIGALTGGTLLGLLGALIAIPVTASTLMIMKQVWVPRQEKR